MIASPTLSLLRQMVLRDLRLRYRSTFLGFFWSLAKPGALILLFYVIFQVVMRIGEDALGNDFGRGANYGVFVAIGIITWTFFSGALVQGVPAYLDHQHLITKAYFWRPVLPLACAVSNWVHYLFAQAVLVVFLRAMGCHHWETQLLWLLPLSFLELALVAGLLWLLSWFHTLARDTLQFVELGLMVWFYGSPVIYPASLVYKSDLFSGDSAASPLAIVYLLNPLAPILVVRQRLLLSNYLKAPSFLHPTPDQLQDSLILALFSIAALAAFAWRLNRKVNRQIADRI